MGMLERMREPRAEVVAPRGPPLPEAPGCRAGVSSTSFRNCALFMVCVIAWWKVVAGLDYVGVVSEDPLGWLLPSASFLPSTEFDCCLHCLLKIRRAIANSLLYKDHLRITNCFLAFNLLRERLCYKPLL